jgi:hypothetical protein
VLRAAVESQVPETVERAILLAMVQQEILAEAKPWAHRQQLPPKPDHAVLRVDAPRLAAKIGTGDLWKDRQLRDLWKDRQLRDYRWAKNLCFRCGEKYDPTHQCPRKPAAELDALATEETQSDEVLNMIEMQDIAEAQQLSLSIHALAGTLRAMVIRCFLSWSIPAALEAF